MSIEKPFWHPSAASAFLFDWDGVIADTKLDFTPIRERYYGGRRAMLLEEASTLAPDERESLMNDLRSLELKGAENAVHVPGAPELLDRLVAQNIPFAVISRNCTESIEAAAEKIGVKLPEHVWSRDNSEWVKPDPRSLTHAAAVLGVPIHETVFIGDFIYDLQCARRAGVRSVLVQRDEPEWGVWTDASYKEMKDLLLEMKGDHIIIFSTHILQLAADLCDEIVILNHGQLEGVDRAMIHAPEFEARVVELLK
ncbi:MAG: HAD-IA family hydrolase, partial [Synergistaceae bacterium]